MNLGFIYPLVILFEEKEPILSGSISYFSPLPNPFGTATSLERCEAAVCCNRSNSVDLGNRRFQKLIVETYKILGTDTCAITEEMSTEESIPFRSGNPVVETTEGIIHVYKNEREPQPKENLVTSTMLCIFSVPSHITVKDLLSFVTPMRGTKGCQERRPESLHGSVKVPFTGIPVKFICYFEQQETDQFYQTYNNTCYTNLESEVCQLMYVSHVDKTNPAVGVAFPTKGLLELPSCPVCLERLDEPVQGILTTILCNHTFHDDCIARVEDATCPVCRYVQSPELLDDSQCADCCIRENLWICLICGRIGCGRYGRKHAHRHFEETGHTFALELGKNLVWDYADDAYVHRLAVNHEDGKLVQLGSGSETGDKKTDMISLEFSAVLTSQLESQRAYFEAQLEQVTTESTNRIQAAEARIEELVTTLKTVQKQLHEVTKEKATYSRKLQQALNSVQRLQKELEEEREMNKSLMQNEAIWRDRAELAEANAKSAQDECNELLLNLEFRSKLSELASSEQITADEIENSEISIQPQQAGCSRRRKKR
ncbi:hypothetical protein EG68_06452 [Paragonimus skrjabini miyazakii]|uniref:BRCA1-associated protein n=1 Tax=Paragonimus skrjabini miyazakii TaxID=59628 RepID=A0A8S9YUM4_9TREM|nr:hypothetical protein EG68_06452 [Paragonimus skrjabini miyazakii]